MSPQKRGSNPLRRARRAAPSADDRPVVEETRGAERAQDAHGRRAVVGIAASAGGLEAIVELLENLSPSSGMAFVVIQHLAPSHVSMLSEILARITHMVVRQAKQGTRIEPDHVYVIPPDRDLAIAQGRVRLRARAKGPEKFLPADHFFRSLADDCGNRAVGVILSGTGSDGVEGLRAIKSAGGITFAQDEASAKCPEMPRSAVASGVVDIVLPPAGIARELGRLTSHAYVAHVAEDKVPPGDASLLERVLRLLRVAKGTDFTHYKQSTIRRRVLRRMALARIENLKDYVALLESNRPELDALYDDALINVTSFFREPAAFRALGRRVVSALLRKRSNDARLRIWVPGCSTGEEAYSIAITLLEAIAERKHAVQLQIFGTDLSENVIETARSGRYSGNIASDVSPERLRHYFVRSGDGYQVAKVLRDACVFAKHDLLKDPPFSKIDLLSCRNVLIYFGSVLQKKAVALFHYALRPDGLLMLGASEHIGGFADLFTLVDKKHKIYARKPVPSRLYFGTGAEATAAAIDASSLATGRADAQTGDLQREADRIVMSRYAPAGVVVDEDLDIIQFRGHTGPYLEPRSGAASLNLLRMVREGLLLDLRAAFQQAKKSGAASRREGVRMRVDGQFTEVSVEVVPFHSQDTRGRLYLVLFDARAVDGGAKTAKPPRGTAAKRSGAARRVFADAEKELAATKDYLQTIIEEQEATNEELMSANEEILSSNEELQSTNEELETAKEELQSSNEELSTVNDELHNRNGELNDVNNDLTMLLGSVQVPMVILDASLRVRRVTPLAERLLNLIPADVGRRLTDIRANIEMPDLERVVQEVIDTVTQKDLDVRDALGRWYSMRVRPFKTRDHKIDGVVITWIDVDLAKQTSLKASRDVAASLLSISGQPAAIVGADLRVVAANEPWTSLFADGRAAPASWGDARLVAALRDAAASGRATKEWASAPDARGGSTTILIRADVLPTEGPDPALLLVVENSGAENGRAT